MSPEQVIILPISEKFADYAQEIKALLDENDVTSSIDHRDEKIGRKIRDAEVMKTPFMLIVGEKEQELKHVSVRRHGEGDLGSMSADEFVNQFKGIVKEEINK